MHRFLDMGGTVSVRPQSHIASWAPARATALRVHRHLKMTHVPEVRAQLSICGDCNQVPCVPSSAHRFSHSHFEIMKFEEIRRQNAIFLARYFVCMAYMHCLHATRAEKFGGWLSRRVELESVFRSPKENTVGREDPIRLRLRERQSCKSRTSFDHSTRPLLTSHTVVPTSTVHCNISVQYDGSAE